MGKWQRNFNKVEFQPGHSWYSFAVDMESAQHIVAAHNADIDALTAEKQRIADECFEAKTQLSNRTAERDEARAKLAQWRSDFSKAMERAKQAEAKLDAIIAMLEPGPAPCDCEHCYCGNAGNAAGMSAWRVSEHLHARAVAIREGRG